MNYIKPDPLLWIVGTMLKNRLGASPTSLDSWFQLFLRIVNGAFQGNLDIGQTRYVFNPRLLRPYDLLRKIDKPQDDFERLISQLDQRFIAAAKSEMYRTSKG